MRALLVLDSLVAAVFGFERRSIAATDRVGSVAVAVGAAGTDAAAMAGAGGATSGVAGAAAAAIDLVATVRAGTPAAMVDGGNGPEPMGTAAVARLRCDRLKTPAPKARTSTDAPATVSQVLCAAGGT